MKNNTHSSLKRVFLVLFALSAALSSTLGFSQDLKILVPRTLSSLPVLELSGTEVAGRPVAVEIFDDHPLAMAALVTGKADLLLTGFSTGLARWAASRDIVHGFTPVWGVSSLVAVDPALKTLADFQGKTIMVPFAGSPLEIQLKVLLAQGGLEGKVKIDFAPIPQQIPLLLQGKVQGISVPEPLVTRLKTQNGALQVFTFAQAWSQVNNGDPRSPQVSFYLPKAGGPGQALLKALQAAVKAAVENLKKDPAPAAQRHSSALQVPAPLIIAGLENTLFDLPQPAEEQQLIRSYLGITKEVSPVPPQEFFALP